jgi:hypothetical protein
MDAAPDETFGVAAARILDAIADALGEEPREPSSLRQQDFARTLGLDVSVDTVRVASAKIADALLVRNVAAVKAMELGPGDVVEIAQRGQIDGKECVLEQEFVVSSVRPNGRLFFKGGNGRGAWAAQVRKVPNKSAAGQARFRFVTDKQGP